MIDLITRAEWGARKPRGSYSPLTSTRGVKVHYTGGRVEPATLADHRLCIGLVKSFQSFHMDGHGWIDLGYSLVACSHRKVFVGRGPKHVPAANGAGLNSGHYAVLGLVGNKGLVEPTDDLLHAILDAIEYLREHGGAGREIEGHRDGYATDCPGGPLYAWVQRGAPRPGNSPEIPNSSSSPDAWPGRLFRYPSGVQDVPMLSGPDVRRWQQQMRDEHAFELDVDGRYGPRSRTVCLTFQRRVDLLDDGIVGRLTWEAAFRPPSK